MIVLKEIIRGLLSNSALITAVIAMLSAQIIKIFYYFIVERKLNIIHFFEAGGMPSSHSALVCSLCAMIGFIEGFDSILFAAASVFAAIVMYDAIQVRAEEVGHTLVEVGAGGVLGLIAAIVSYLYF